MSSVHDEALAARVRNSLAMDKRVSGLPVDARVSNGDVFLKGSVNSLEEADVIQFIVSGIPAVRHVDVSELEIREKDR